MVVSENLRRKNKMEKTKGPNQKAINKLLKNYTINKATLGETYLNLEVY